MPFKLPPLPGPPSLPKLARDEPTQSAKPAHDPHELGITLGRRGKDPTAWLRPHQQRLAEASRIAGEQTKNLKGPARVVAKGRIVRELLKTPQDTP